MVAFFLLCLCLALLPVTVHSVISIDECGAIAETFSEVAALANSRAIQQCLLKANNVSSSLRADRTVLVPGGSTYHVLNFTVSDLKLVTLQIDGHLEAMPEISSWPVVPHPEVWAILEFQRCTNLELTGTGTVNGHGYNWWEEVLFHFTDLRPHLVRILESENVVITNLNFYDSPQYHLKMDDLKGLVVRNVTIQVDLDGQRHLKKKHPRPEGDLFPLNTDGMDLAVINALVENCTITNFDDAVAVKPLNKKSKMSHCSQNQLIRNLVVYWGVGATIGSVPSNPDHNCVRNITFEDVTFHHPIKAVYVKTNPNSGGAAGSAEIRDIFYRRLTAHESLWYPIWIGPQQQKQPNTTGTGCSFFYPIVPECPTNPHVIIDTIQIEDAVFTDGVTLPGVLLCDEKRPCLNVLFSNVTNTGNFWVSDQYDLHFAEGKSAGVVEPGLDWYAPSNKST